MRKLFLVLVVLLFATVFTQAQDVTEVHVLVTFDKGVNESQQAVLNDLQARFNEMHEDIELVFDFTESDDMVALISSEDAPDIVGPLGFVNFYRNQPLWADISPWIADYDMSDYPAGVIDRMRFGERIGGLPVGVFPSVIFFNKDLFDEAGVNYPPQEFGTDNWDFDALSRTAQRLTVDANGFTAREPEFDNEDTVQWGYDDSWSNLREMLALWGADTMGVSDDWHTIDFDNEEWVTGLQWVQNGIYEVGFIPTGGEVDSLYDTGAANPFQSGLVAMFYSHAWFPLQGLIGETPFAWDIAATPSAADGEVHARLHGEAFAVTPKGAENEATWTVLTWLAEPEQSVAFCGLDMFTCVPVRLSARDDARAILDELAPDVTWDVLFEAIDYMDNPSHERWLPNIDAMDELLSGVLDELYYGDGSADFAAMLAELDNDAQTVADQYWAEQD
jgi:multiple sugar transport system substrate-binding protein